jgi:small-conductance mechanosensitive channel
MNIIPVRIAVPLEMQDQRLMQIEELINAKRNMLIDKQKQIKKIQKHNRFLEEVANDYNKYNNYIVQQKRDQVKALELLNHYIHDLTVSGNLTKNNLKDAKQEQRKILREMNLIRKNLDEIIGNTDIVENQLREKNILD